MSQPADVQSGAYSALIAANNTGLLGGMFGGIRAPAKIAGKYFTPPHLTPSLTSASFSTTAARYYFVPFYIDRPTTFAGAWFFNGGTGDNTKNGKIAAYAEAAAGGPGALAKSFGAAGITATAALRTLASSWAATPGWYYLAFVNDSAATMYAMAPSGIQTNVGLIGTPLAMQLGRFSYAGPSAAITNGGPAADYVAGTYANFPEATALTPTATADDSVGVPLFGLYT